jgi:hypothetical protein
VSNPKRRIPWYLWPFYAIWRLVTLLLDATGRLLCGVLGLVLMVVGTMLSLTVVGAVLGVPLILVGVLLVVRALF